MKTFKLLALILLVSVSAIAVKSVIPMFTHQKTILETISATDPYAKLWAKSDSLVDKGLTRSAIEVVQVIYSKAKTESNTDNFIKAVIYKLKLQSQISDDDYVKEIGDLKSEIAEAHFPAKPILQSMTAEIYWKYYENNRYKFLNRTETVDFVPADIRTWDLRKIIEQVIQNYQLSIASADSLKKTSIHTYQAILVNQYANSLDLRPTLFDFLAHRAADFFMNEEPGLVSPVNRFEIDNATYFEPFDKFMNEKITTPDNFSLTYYAATIFQDLIKFHTTDTDPKILIDNDLKRLKFVRQKSIHPDKDTLYISALNNLNTRFESFPASSEVIYEIANYYYIQGLNYGSTKDETQRWLLKKAYEICNRAILKFPDAFGTKNCQYLQNRITEKSLTLTAEEINTPNKPFRALLNYKNINQVWVRICKMDYEYNDKLVAQYYYDEKLVKEYLKLTPLTTFSVNLTNSLDYQNHATELKLPETAPGFYIILVGTDKNFSTQNNAVCYNSFWVSNMAYLHRTLTNGNVQFVVTHRETGAPLPGVSAQVYHQTYNYTSRKYEYTRAGHYYTDMNGMFETQPSTNDYYSSYVEFSFNSDIINHDQLKSENFYQYRNYNDNQVKKYLRTVYFADRGIYRPGQTLFFKGLLLETDGETIVIKPGVETTVVLYDVNYQKVSELKLTSNEYGTFSGSFTLPTGSLNGQMHLGDTWGNLYFSVEEYKRPKFEVDFNPVKGSYKLGEKVSVKGTAKAYSGSNIDNAQVNYRVVRTTSFPYWWYYWYGYYPTSATMEIANGKTTTNDVGEFTIDFKAVPDYKVSKKSEPTFTYQVVADVTDINGETRSTTTTVVAAYKALMVAVNTPTEIEKSSADSYLISTTNLSGTYEYAKGKIHIYKLKQPEKPFRSRLWAKPDLPQIAKADYYQWFPYDLYEDEDNTAKWEKETETLNLNFDTQKDSLLKIDNLAAYKSGQYMLEITSVDKYGETVQSYSYFTIYSNNDKSIPSNAFDWFTVINDKGEPGTSASFLIGSKETNVSVLMEVEVKNKIVETQLIKLNNELKRIDVPIKEEYRGNFAVHFSFILHGRVYQHDVTIEVPYTNKQLDISFETFRNKLLPGQQEEWKIKIKGKNGEKVAAEMLATMYDASLDAFRSNSWALSLYTNYYMQRQWESNNGFSVNNSSIYSYLWNPYQYYVPRTYNYLNWFGYDVYNYRYSYYLDDMDGAYDFEQPDQSIVVSEITTASRGYHGNGERALKKAEAGVVPMGGAVATGKSVATGDFLEADEKNIPDAKDKSKEERNFRGEDLGGEMDLGAVKTRTNFNETAFFYPHLLTNENGEIVISFTVPEALTKWKFMGLAQTKDLKYAQIQKEIITQKDLMVAPNPPRFFREGDQIVFSSKITNLSTDSINGQVSLMLFNAETQQPIDALMKNNDQIKCFGIGKGQSTAAEWTITVPDGITAITYKVVARAGNFSDGEEMIIPVLTNRMLVTETMPLPIRGNQIKEFNFQKLIDAYKSNTQRNYKLTLEFTSNPSWYAVQALPYLAEYPYECTEQIFSRFYANSIATHIVNSNPKIKEVFESWKNITPDALLSNLEKNQDLKYVMLQETPWMMEAKDESQSKRNISILFENKRMEREIERALKKLETLQLSNGGWTWFPGMPDDRYITQHIITGMCHLDKLGVRDVRDQQRVWTMIKRGSHYLDDRLRDDYEWLLKWDPQHMFENHLGGIQIQYLYARSYFVKEIPVEAKNAKAFAYYFGQAKKYWLPNNYYLQGMIALAMNRLDDKLTATDIIKSLKENAIHNDEMGMYWKNLDNGYYWYQAPVETQALLIECFDEVANDQTAVEEMKVWLLKQKQTQNWKTTKSTAEACYALLLRGTDWLAKDPQVTIMMGNMLIDPKQIPDVKVQAGTGYFRTSWFNDAIQPEMGKVKITKSDDGVAWGALYWQYFEQLDKITSAETPLKIVKQLFVERSSDHGPVITPITVETKLKLGDKIKVRIELRVDRDMEYVHMKDMRASGFEPINVISKYKYQGGIGYYESTGDAATNFFISKLLKGTYVFEYPLRVAQKGDFSNGVTTIQCMYAPEFSAHSEGIRVKVSG
ncbi:MAG: alpha-2-macroglobulin family protein [Bacteroidota bacterium]